MALMALSFSASVICILFVFANVIKKSGKTIFHGNYGRSALFDGGGDGEKAYDAVIEEDALDFLADLSGGDARHALNAVELGIMTTE